MRFLIPHMAEDERRNSMERVISASRIRSSSSGAGGLSSSVAVAGDETNAQEDARNNKNYAATAEKKHRCCRICKYEFKTKRLRTQPSSPVQEPAALTGHTVAAKAAAAEERTASSRNAPFESRNPALVLQSVQLDEGPSAANGARRPHYFDLNEPAAPEEEPEPEPEPERKDDDPDDLLSFRLWPKFDSQRSN